MSHPALKKLTLITSLFESPYSKNEALYNEQLFLKLRNIYDINIIRPLPRTIIKGTEWVDSGSHR